MPITIDGSGTISGVSATGITTAQTVSASNITTGTLPKAQLPTGSVLQVVNASLQIGLNSTTSTSFVSSPLTASITPTSSSSKIFIVVSSQGVVSSTSYVTAYTIYRNSTNLGSSTGMTFIGSAQSMSLSLSYLDSPATTSSTTYTVYFRVNGGTGYMGDTLGGVSPISSIVLMEISA
jgi:hypothetical protein